MGILTIDLLTVRMCALTEPAGLVICEHSPRHVHPHVTAAALVVQAHGPHHGGHRSADHHLQHHQQQFSLATDPGPIPEFVQTWFSCRFCVLGTPANCGPVPIDNFLHHRALAYKLLVTMELKANKLSAPGIETWTSHTPYKRDKYYTIQTRLLNAINFMKIFRKLSRIVEQGQICGIAKF